MADWWEQGQKPVVVGRPSSNQTCVPQVKGCRQPADIDDTYQKEKEKGAKGLAGSGRWEKPPHTGPLPGMNILATIAFPVLPARGRVCSPHLG